MNVSERCPHVSGWERIRADHSSYLHDESRLSATGLETIYFPRTLDELAAAVSACNATRTPLTVAGARTGIVGGAVPEGTAAVVSLERLNRIKSMAFDERTRTFSVELEAGVTLEQLNRFLRTTPPESLPWNESTDRQAALECLSEGGTRLFYPIDPTETTAQIGGTVSTNASGARSFRYGATRDWVLGLTVVLANGGIVSLRRGDGSSPAGGKRTIVLETGSDSIPVPVLPLPRPLTKHNAGYYLSPEMDAADLFIGSEGTLGIVGEVRLGLAPEPGRRLYVTAFFGTEERAIRFTHGVRSALRGHRAGAFGIDSPAEPSGLLALEYVGFRAFELLREKRADQGASSGVPPLPAEARCSVFLDFAAGSEHELDTGHETVAAELARAGANPRKTWASCAHVQLERMKAFRHAVPELINTIIGHRRRSIGDRLHKIATDMAVPDEYLEEIVGLYRSRLEERGLEYVLFGHIGDNHLHVNILPRSLEDQSAGMSLYEEFAHAAVKRGGSVAAEHGIGRLKKPLLAIQYDSSALETMRAVKRALDPRGILNPGLLF